MRIRLLALATTLACGFAAGAAGEVPPTVVVMVFDGFEPSLLEGAETPALDRMRREGAWTHDLHPAFPSISLINGFTLSTGCWPEHHGIVTNLFLDPERGLYDHSREADWLTGCEGLHEVAERQGVRTATLDWYGARSETRGELASLVLGRGFEHQPPDPERGREVAELLALDDEERPRLVLAYLRGPDQEAHFTGMDSPETRAAVEASDRALGEVLAAVDALPPERRERVSLLVTTDHGMLPVTHLVNIRRILARHGIPARALSTGTTSLLYFDDASQVDAAVERLSEYEEFQVLRRDALPAYAHLGTGPRVGQLVVSAQPPYFIEDTEAWPAWLRWLGRWGPDVVWARPFLKASHGYPPDTPGMSGILYAWGAGIASGREVRGLRAVDLHPTVAHLLGIAPGRPVDGRVATELLD